MVQGLLVVADPNTGGRVLGLVRYESVLLGGGGRGVEPWVNTGTEVGRLGLVIALVGRVGGRVGSVDGVVCTCDAEPLKETPGRLVLSLKYNMSDLKPYPTLNSYPFIPTVIPSCLVLIPYWENFSRDINKSKAKIHNFVGKKLQIGSIIEVKIHKHTF
jgi:hypothetical protein